MSEVVDAIATQYGALYMRLHREAVSCEFLKREAIRNADTHLAQFYAGQMTAYCVAIVLAFNVAFPGSATPDAITIMSDIRTMTDAEICKESGYAFQ